MRAILNGLDTHTASSASRSWPCWRPKRRRHAAKHPFPSLLPIVAPSRGRTFTVSHDPPISDRNIGIQTAEATLQNTRPRTKRAIEDRANPAVNPLIYRTTPRPIPRKSDPAKAPAIVCGQVAPGPMNDVCRDSRAVPLCYTCTYISFGLVVFFALVAVWPLWASSPLSPDRTVLISERQGFSNVPCQPRLAT